MRLQTRLVLLMTAGLLLAGTGLFWVLEAGRLTSYPFWNQALIALFHSASSRTAGFNTVDVALWADPTYFFMALLMFVGASPGGTGGGVKTSTIGIAGGLVHATLLGRRHVEMFRRTISLACGAAVGLDHHAILPLCQHLDVASDFDGRRGIRLDPLRSRFRLCHGWTLGRPHAGSVDAGQTCRFGHHARRTDWSINAGFCVVVEGRSSQLRISGRRHHGGLSRT